MIIKEMELTGEVTTAMGGEEVGGQEKGKEQVTDRAGPPGSRKGLHLGQADQEGLHSLEHGGRREQSW